MACGYKIEKAALANLRCSIRVCKHVYATTFEAMSLVVWDQNFLRSSLG